MRTIGLFILSVFVFVSVGCGDDDSAYYSGGGYYEPSVVNSYCPNAETNSSVIYFSYDDSASTAAVELSKYQLGKGVLPDSSLGRAWEFLNYEQFTAGTLESTGLFNVSMGLWEREPLSGSAGKDYKLGVYVSSPWIGVETRSNVVITLIVDISGSMGSDILQLDSESTSRLDLVKSGLLRMLEYSLKDGDVLNLVTFSSSSKVLFSNYSYSAKKDEMISIVNGLALDGSTDLNAGVNKGYQVARNTFDPGKINRVILLTDAYANTGEIDPDFISQYTSINEQEGIYFSALGISGGYNEPFLDKLTEAGKGGFFSILTKTDANRAFEDRFISLVNVAARDVRFKLEYPSSLKHILTASESSSTNIDDVLPSNFSYNTSQYFFEGFRHDGSGLVSSDLFTLTIMYKDPATGVEKTEVFSKTVADVLGLQNGNIRDAECVYLFTQLVARKMSSASIYSNLNMYYTNYSSSLADEYRNLIRIYTNLSVGE